MLKSWFLVTNFKIVVLKLVNKNHGFGTDMLESWFKIMILVLKCQLHGFGTNMIKSWFWY